MSKQNVERLREAFDNFLAGGRDWGTELLHPEVEWDASDIVFDLSGVFHGVEAVQQYWRDWLAAWETIQFEYELVDVADRVVALIDQRMRGRSSGIDVGPGKYAHVYTFKDGLIVHWKLYISQSEALKAVGLEAWAMSENLDLVRSLYADWERGDFGSTEWAHPEIEFAMADGPSPTSWSGLTAMANAWGDFLKSFEEYRSEVEELRELDDDRVLVLTKGTARGGKTTGAAMGQQRVGQRGAALFQVRGGRVTRLVVYFHRDRALADLGLASEADSP